jgi:hypothetical protein
MPALNTPPSCSLCGDSGHNIRYCRDSTVAHLLLQTRYKKTKSSQTGDTFTLFNWLHKLIPTELKAILIHKYHVTPKTSSKRKLIAIIMEYEFPHVGENAYWNVYLPVNFHNEMPVDVQNEDERRMILQNISYYGPISIEQQSMTSNELIIILIRLREENRNNARARYRHNINYINYECNVDELFECVICYEEMKSDKKVILNCNHEFCGVCIERHIEKTRSANVMCPMCRTDISIVSEIRIV